jgi:peptidoglycan/LPS O-acetylase OafA/YrhL
MQTNQNIQVLRGIAILSVLAFHAKSGFFPNGYLGVDIFFFISGFLVIPKMINAIDANSLKLFYVKRFYRLAPALLFTIVLTFPLILVFGSWKSHQDFIFQTIWTLLLMGNIGSILVTGNYFEPNSFLPMVHTWSLAVEEQIYLLLPLAIKFKKALLPALSGMSFLLYISQDMFGESTSNALFYLFISRIWEFHVGYLVAQARWALKPINVWFGQLIVGFLLLFLLFPDLWSRNLGTITSLAAASCFVLCKPLSGCHIELLKYIGDRAYSLYLFHMPLLYLAKYSPLIYGDDRSIYSFMAVGLTLLLAEISYRKVEFIMKSKNPR